MIKFIALTLILLPGFAQAVICKTVEPDGSVSYADVAASECPQEVKLPPYSSYAPRQVQSTPAQDGTARGTLAPFVRYESIRIAQPAGGGTVRNNEGKVPVSIALVPPLQENHTITLYLDGNAVPGSFDGSAIDLSGVQRGSHTLKAAVFDASGRRLIESQATRFTMRQSSTYDLPKQPEHPIEPPPEPKPPYQPPAQPGYTPSAPADYKPNAGGISSTPGKTNPAFAPKYNP
jgi:hypothetical protein